MIDYRSKDAEPLTEIETQQADVDTYAAKLCLVPMRKQAYDGQSKAVDTHWERRYAGEDPQNDPEEVVPILAFTSVAKQEDINLIRMASCDIGDLITALKKAQTERDEYREDVLARMNKLADLAEKLRDVTRTVGKLKAIAELITESL